MNKKIKTILFVDDDQDDQLLFREALMEADNTAIYLSAYSGIEALEKLNSGEIIIPDLMFMDINMPKITGIDCLKKLKESEKLKNIPIIMYSTSCSGEYQKDCLDNGALGFLEKPRDFGQLCDKIKAILNNGLIFHKNNIAL